MDEGEARSLATARLDALRAVPYAGLVDRLAGRVETDEVVGPSSARCQVEVQAVWDRREGENLRVIVSVDDGGLRAFAPVTEDFIVRPDGSFVGE